MFSSGVRNISFQDLFARPPPHPLQNATVSGDAVNCGEEEYRDPEEVARAARTAAAAARVLATPHCATVAAARPTPPLPSSSSPDGYEKASLGFILGGLQGEAPQRDDTRLRWLLTPPSQHHQQYHHQLVHIKREPTELFGMGDDYQEHRDYHELSNDSMQGTRWDIPVFAHGRASISSSNDSGDSSDTYERAHSTREVVRLPSIISSANSSPLQQPYPYRHHNYHCSRDRQQQQQQYESQLELPADVSLSSLPADTTSGRRKKKRKARICKELGCDKYVVDHGLCIRHGGGKRCNVEDCNCRAQNRGLCWKHGGYTICKVEDCTKRAKSRGICWSHGGGTRCKSDGCSKIAVSLGRCWAHGGGKRCSIESCKKPASERTNNLCADHFVWFQQEQGGRTGGDA